MKQPIDLLPIRNITVSGRIASGASSLAHGLENVLQWDVLDGGKLFRKYLADQGHSILNQDKIPDSFDLAYEEHIKQLLKDKEHNIIQSHLAGYDAQGIEGVFKILVVCEDKDKQDKLDIRIDRLVNRDGISVEEAKHEVQEREAQHLAKFRRLYANNDQQWVYWDQNYYDLIVNTYMHNKEETLSIVLHALGYVEEK